mmetsp:Transcript_77492/g.155304  ORF Transcript_77492/g.155304 Transcript_77492/m.155304 type:complete len:91 (+) Transcript_77492:3-275(+)
MSSSGARPPYARLCFSLRVLSLVVLLDKGTQAEGASSLRSNGTDQNTGSSKPEQKEQAGAGQRQSGGGVEEARWNLKRKTMRPCPPLQLA